MKFEYKYPDAGPTDRFEHGYSYVTKSPRLGSCRCCAGMTRWLDVLFHTPTCSEECADFLWRKYREDSKDRSVYDDFERHFDEVRREMRLAAESPSAAKDILVVVYDQLEYLKPCVESIAANTKDYHLYVWDNGSSAATEKYLESLMANHDHEKSGLSVMRSDTNVGFIRPNNEMAAWGDSEYLILLNSDTKVFEGWDRAMTGFLGGHPDVGLVGFWGGHLGPDGRGFGGSNGYDIDYVPGWCMCMRRSLYEAHGLFDDRLRFAYCEDADLSLRVREAGLKIYALYSPLVHHYQNKTVAQVDRESAIDLRATFEYNLGYMQQRWADYLAKDRCVLKLLGKDSRVEIMDSVADGGQSVVG